MARNIKKTPIILENGGQAEAFSPLIVSASRSTDIPAFYADWFFNRLKKGYSAWINPFNNKKYYVGYAAAKFIVFWSKNPAPLLPYLDYLKSRDIGCYIQFTLNDYEAEKLEPNVPSLSARISVFKTLTKLIGREAVIWRFDPLLLTMDSTVDTLLGKIQNIGDELRDYTEKLVFSFADILPYRKVQNNLARSGVRWLDWSGGRMREFAEKLVELKKARGWNFELASCGETEDLPGITPNQCIDGNLILRLHPRPELLNFLGARLQDRPPLPGLAREKEIDIGRGKFVIMEKNIKDKGQRSACGCVPAKDIGEYNTCPHLCEYCYANSSKAGALKNFLRHTKNNSAETITGR